MLTQPVQRLWIFTDLLALVQIDVHVIQSITVYFSYAKHHIVSSSKGKHCVQLDELKCNGNRCMRMHLPEMWVNEDEPESQCIVILLSLNH